MSVVAGILYGLLVGIGSRLAMLLLRVTSPRQVVIAVLLVPPAILAAGIVVIVLTVLTAIGANPALRNVRCTRTFGLLIRVAWMTIAVAGLAALINDIRQLS